MAFQISDDSRSPPGFIFRLFPSFHRLVRSHAKGKKGPMAQLTGSLSTRPMLRTFLTRLPDLWNEKILQVSTNPALERIILVDDYGRQIANPEISLGRLSETEFVNVYGSDFFIQAEKHARLTELIEAGMYGSSFNFLLQKLKSGWFQATPLSAVTHECL